MTCATVRWLFSNHYFDAIYPMMKPMGKRLFLAQLLLFLLSGLAQAAISEGDLQWIREQLIKPKSNLDLIITVNKKMLDPPAAHDRSSGSIIQYSTMSNEELEKEINTNKPKAEASIEAYRRLQRINKSKEVRRLLSLTLRRILSDLEKDDDNWQLVEEALSIYLRHGSSASDQTKR